MSTVRRFFAVLLVVVLCTMVGTATVPATGQEQLPVPREETIFLEDRPNIFVAFDSFNTRIPNGNDFANGYVQVGQEYLFLGNAATGEYEPWLGKSWEYNEDYTELTIFLQEAAHWNDGTPFTADDVVFTILTVRDNTALGGGEVLREFVAEAEAVDAHTVKLTFTKPAPRFHYELLAMVGGFEIWPKHIWENQDPTTFKNNPPITTAVWKLREVLPDLRMFVWERDDNYWAKDIRFPEAKYIVYREAPASPDVDYAEFVANQIDHAHWIQYPQMVQAMEENPKIQIAPYPDPCPRGMWFNTQRYPLSLPEVRWALSYALDREKIAKFIWQPETEVALWPWSSWPLLDRFRFDDVMEEYKIEFDPAKAEALLDGLGFAKGDDGIRVDGEGNRMAYTIITPLPVGEYEYQIAQELAEGAANIGIEMTVKHLPQSAFDEATRTGDFDVTSHWLCWAPLDALQLYQPYTSDQPMPGESASPPNWIGLEDAEFDDAVARLKVINPDDPAAEAIYKDAFRAWMRLMPVLPVVQTVFVMPWNTTYWEGWPVEGNWYTLPFTWWPTFAKVPFALKSTQQ